MFHRKTKSVTFADSEPQEHPGELANQHVQMDAIEATLRQRAAEDASAAPHEREELTRQQFELKAAQQELQVGKKCRPAASKKWRTA